MSAVRAGRHAREAGGRRGPDDGFGGTARALSFANGASPRHQAILPVLTSPFSLPKSDTTGQTPTPSLLSNLLTDPSGHRAQSINFTQFLSMMGRHLLALDAEHDLLEAFACFDEGDKGWVKVDEVRKLLAEMGDRMDEREVSLVKSHHASGLGARGRGSMQ